MLVEVAGIALDPNAIAQAGVYSLAGVEIFKRYIPNLFPEGSTKQRAIVLPVIAGIIASLFAGGPITLASVLTTAVNYALGATAAGTVHDRVVTPVLNPVLDKIPGQPAVTK